MDLGGIFPKLTALECETLESGIGVLPSGGGDLAKAANASV